MKVLVTGYKGQLGYDVVNEATSRGIQAIGVDIDEMDITNQEQVNTVIKSGNYDAVVHCAAWTAVDKAEEPELFETGKPVLVSDLSDCEGKLFRGVRRGKSA